jgi:peptidoglycan hydrolase-like protein with peptidoglycan-binding domain
VGQVPGGKIALGIASPVGGSGYVIALGPPPVPRGPFGPTVLDLQRRLNDLGYWTPMTGQLDALTQQAVYALEKAAGLARRGTVGAEERRALEDGLQPTPRTGFGYTVEINKSRQLLMVVLDGRPLYTFNTSTGSNTTYYSDGRRAYAYTPEGHFAIYRTVNGQDISPLGELWRPRYFTGGYAIHGSKSIPPYPASHGCARLSNAATDFIWAAGLMPIGTPVWVYS